MVELAEAQRSSGRLLSPARPAVRLVDHGVNVRRVTNSAQAGIFALGTASHCYVELDIRGGVEARDLVSRIASQREPRTTMGGVNLVTGFRPELWRAVAPDASPAGIEGFNHELKGPGNFKMPGTQHDAVLWISGSAYDVVFDMARQSIAELEPITRVAEETSSWSYHHDRDLTGFIDGSENPSLIDAPDIALVADPSPGAGGSILLLQKWSHDAAAWESQPVPEQERVIGRTKLDSVELRDRPANSHVGRTDQDVFGKIFRRNLPYGTVTDHGTMFVGFSAEQRRLTAMLESMAGLTDGTRDRLTYFARPLTGSYYFIPSISDLRQFVDPAAL
jgi:putative iron-dependent peroxidase